MSIPRPRSPTSRSAPALGLPSSLSLSGTSPPPHLEPGPLLPLGQRPPVLPSLLSLCPSCATPAQTRRGRTTSCSLELFFCRMGGQERASLKPCWWVTKETMSAEAGTCLVQEGCCPLCLECSQQTRPRSCSPPSSLYPDVTSSFPVLSPEASRQQTALVGRMEVSLWRW